MKKENGFNLNNRSDLRLAKELLKVRIKDKEKGIKTNTQKLAPKEVISGVSNIADGESLASNLLPLAFKYGGLLATQLPKAFSNLSKKKKRIVVLSSILSTVGGLLLVFKRKKSLANVEQNVEQEGHAVDSTTEQSNASPNLAKDASTN